MALPSGLIKFKPGQSGNPGGRPKGFASHIQRLCGKDGRKLAKAWMLIAWGSDAECLEFFGQKIKRDVDHRLRALEQLGNRGYGRPLTLTPDAPELEDRMLEPIINLPAPPSELVGRRVVTRMFEIIDVPAKAAGE